MPLVLLVACAVPAAVSTPAPPAAPAETSPGSNTRVVAVGDLHGDLDAALATLRLVGLVDEEGAWIGGEARLVQTGDTTDRGPDSRGVLALLRRLQVEARAAGGAVVPLLGNHEVMNLQGDWRYVSDADLDGYGGADARRRAFAPDGDDGAWLRGLDAVATIDGTVFVHGGVDARWAAVGVDAINARVRAAIDAPGDPVLGPDGPLWNRAFVLDDEPAACTALGEALAAMGATRMVVGHTTQRAGVPLSRCDGRLWAIDTGISAHYGRHLAALELTGATVQVRAAP
jgi:hypothetical protein